MSTYYFKVSGAPNSGVFGIGGYQATVTYNVLPVLGYTPLTGVYSVLNHTLQTALALPRAFGNNTDQRFDYLHKATLFFPSQQDYYQIQSPSAAAGTTFVMHALAWELDVNGLHPVIHVFDAQNFRATDLVKTGGFHTVSLDVRFSTFRTIYQPVRPGGRLCSNPATSMLHHRVSPLRALHPGTRAAG